MRLLAALNERVLLADGAMGTELQRAGLEPGGCGEAWNLDHPERVLAIHRAYATAGADCLITNTFGGTPLALGRHGEDSRCVALNRAAVELARRALAGRSDRPGFVLGDVGPFGGLLQPFGATDPDDARAAFDVQVAALVDAGVDAILVETQTSLEELGLAVAAARAAGAPCVLASLAYDVTHDGQDLRTMMGVGLADAARFVADAGADGIGLNCGTGIDMTWAARATERYRAACDLPVVAQLNAGQPELVDLQVVYRQSPMDLARDLGRLLDAGVAIVGGCCGTGPDHIAALRRGIDDHAGSRPEAP